MRFLYIVRSQWLLIVPQTGETGTPFCTSSVSSVFIAGLFVVFAATHFFFDTSVFNNLAEPFDCLLNRFVFS